MARKSNGTGTFKTIGIVFTVLGIIFLMIPVGVTINQSNYDEKYDAVQAIITDIETYRSGDDTHHTTYVSYEYGGKSYNNVSLSFYSSDMYEGQRYTIYLDPSDPASPKAKMGGAVVLVFAIMGVLFTVAGLSLFLSLCRKGRPELMQTGVRYEAMVTKAGPSGTRINNRTTYHVKAEYTDETGTLRKVSTPLLYFDPSFYVMQNGNKISVYADPAKPKKYYIDIDAMEQSMNGAYRQPGVPYNGYPQNNGYSNTGADFNPDDFDYEGPPRNL